MTRPCPSDPDLLAFHLGILPDGEVEALANHLETCPRCEAELQRMDGMADPLLGVLRGSFATIPAPHQGPDVPEGRGQDRAGGESANAAPSLPGYEVGAPLGKGGMGVVYKARHLRLNRPIALKRLRSVGDRDLARARAEAFALARLQHPNIVQIFEVIEYEGQVYLALELVAGGSLDAAVKGKPQAPPTAARLIETVARAMHYAHQQGLVHRDLKPANILLSRAPDGPGSEAAPSATTGLEGRIPKVTDFGVAKWWTVPSGQTQEGDVIGTPAYMAPEQAGGQIEAIGPATDVYGLGVMLYELLTGRVPLQGPNTPDTLVLVRTQDPVPPRRFQPRIPRDLETICLKCLQKDTGRRYPSALELAEDLARFGRDEPIRARPISVWERTGKLVRRRPALAALVLLGLLVATVGFPGVAWLWLRAEQARQAEAEQRAGAEISLYAGRIALAAHAYQSNQVFTARGLLDLCAPATGRPDLRGWEWHYLRRLCFADLFPDMGHRDIEVPWIQAVSFHPDGRRFVSAAGFPAGALAGFPPDAFRTQPGSLKVWDAATGQCLTTLGGHPGAVWAAVFSPDGRWLASGSADGTVLVRRADTWAPRARLPDPQEEVIALAFSPDSRMLAIGTTKSVRLWSLDYDRSVRTIAHAGGLPMLTFSPDGRRLVTSIYNSDGRAAVQFWDPATGNELGHHLPPGEAARVAFSPDGRFLVRARLKGLEVWDAAASRVLRQLSGHAHSVTALAFDASGQLASGSDDQTVRLWDVATGEERRVFRGHTGGVMALALNADGTRLASGSKDGDVKLWDLTRDPRGLRFRVGNGNGEYLANLGYGPDGHSLLAVYAVPDGKDHHLLGAWDSRSGALLHQSSLNLAIHKQGPHRRTAFSADGRRLVGLDRTDPRAVRVWDTAGGTDLATLHTGQEHAVYATIDGLGDRVAYSSWSPSPSDKGAVVGELAIEEPATGRQLFRPALPPGHIPFNLALSPDGRLLAAALRLHTLVSGRPEPSLRTQIWTWEVATGRKLPALEGPDVVIALGFAPDGTRLAGAGLDGKVYVWDLATGVLCFPPLANPTVITSVAFSPDSRRLASTGMDGLVRLWDTARGNELLTLRGLGLPGDGNYGFVARVTFSPDGSQLAANDWDGMVTVWDAAPASP